MRIESRVSNPNNSGGSATAVISSLIFMVLLIQGGHVRRDD
jgi:hypothetical protein